ncbi:MAG: tRNA lysidine(34) synthetase TilS [Candidatus Zixiibacteriota bacterium]
MTPVARHTPEPIPPLAALRAAGGSRIETLARRVQEYWEDYGRPSRRARILVALSGGPDSVALLATLLREAPRYDWTIGAAHVNYRLRGDESDGEEDFVRRLASTWDVKLHCCHPRRSRSRLKSNLQAWAREARYRFLERTALRHQYGWIAVGHQMDDRAETVAAAILRAGGTFALSGIPPVRGMIIRPLFEATRSEILAFLRQVRIPYRQDSSNHGDAYRRNRIRHHFLPDWERANPAIARGLARLGEQLWRQRVYLEHIAHRLVARAVRCEQDGRVTLAVRRMNRYDPVLDPFVLRDLVSKVGLSLVPRATTVDRFAELRRRRAAGGSVRVEQGKLVIERSQDEIAVWRQGAVAGVKRVPISVSRAGGHVSGVGSWSITTDVTLGRDMGTPDDCCLAHFDIKRLDGPLYLRCAEPGDRYTPIGLRGTKKLMDLLAENGVPAFRRGEVPVLTDAAGILWPIGYPVAARVRVTAHTRRILRVRVTGGPTQ